MKAFRLIGNIRLVVVLSSLMVLTACGISFQTNSLYDGVAVQEKPAKPERIDQAVEPEIFREDGTDFWVTDNPACTTGSVVSDIKHSGKNALKVNWNRDPNVCEWAGFGIGWDGWAGKDLSEIFDYAAVQMYVRSAEGKMFGLPVVLTLEDYSGNMAWSYLGNAYMEGYFLDENWQKVTVPLNTFDLEEDGIDITNIKQLSFELQQSGSMYLDDIELIYYEAPPKEIWRPDLALTKAATYPVQLFDDGFVNNNGWGVMEDQCQQITITNDGVGGSKGIHAQWDTSKEDCYEVAVGASWNNWFPIDMSKDHDKLMLSLAFKSSDNYLGKRTVQLGIEDYDRRRMTMPIKAEYITGEFSPNTWQTINIPLSDLKGDIDVTKVKQFVMLFQGEGEIFIDNIELKNR